MAFRSEIFMSGSIPACAGEPAVDGVGLAPEGVYPRVCGGTQSVPTRLDLIQGLSPRVRGNRQCRPFVLGERGSIPACAGEPGSGASG